MTPTTNVMSDMKHGKLIYTTISSSVDNWISLVIHYEWIGSIQDSVKNKENKKNMSESRDAKFPGILRAVSFHREYWEFCGNIGNFGKYSETLGILK